MELDKTVRLLTESLARTVDRRKFLKQAGTSVFAGMAALAAGHFSLARASASPDPYTPPWPPVCAPPGPYCNITGVSDGSGCLGARGPYDPGASCFQHLYNGQILQCRVFYIYQAGCWTTPSGGGAWTCCDCSCPIPGGGSRSCGCAQYSVDPPPRPDGPLSGK